MTNLYEIAKTHNTALLALAEIDDLPAEVIEDTLEALEGEFKEKALSVAAFFMNQDADIQAMKDAERRISDRRKSLENKVKWMRDYLKTNMQRTGITVIECPQFKISLRNNPESVEILDEDSIPMEFKKVSYSVDKAAIKNAGGCEGARLVRGQSLIIK